MPRIKMDVSEAWLARLQAVLPMAVDTLDGITSIINRALTENQPQPEQVLKMIGGQLEDLKRNISTVRIIF